MNQILPQKQLQLQVAEAHAQAVVAAEAGLEVFLLVLGLSAGAGLALGLRCGFRGLCGFGGGDFLDLFKRQLDPPLLGVDVDDAELFFVADFEHIGDLADAFG